MKKLESFYTGDPAEKLYNMFELIFCHDMLDFVTKQYCLPPGVMNVMYEKLNVEYELFASPLNTFFKKYFSIF